MPGPQAPASRVLLIDASEELPIVLGELLARTGLEIVAASSVITGCEHFDRGAIEAAVVDSDAVTAQELRLLTRRANRSGTPIVLVGTNRPVSAAPDATFLRKPYHYRELVHKIGASLGNVGIQARAAA